MPRSNVELLIMRRSDKYDLQQRVQLKYRHIVYMFISVIIVLVFPCLVTIYPSEWEFKTIFSS